jgi:hypothetical protein
MTANESSGLPFIGITLNSIQIKTAAHKAAKLVFHANGQPVTPTLVAVQPDG